MLPAASTRVAEARCDPRTLHAYVELHIEQGPHLEEARIPIGLVEGIVGIRRNRLTFIGEPDHAGTTPMAWRKDAFLAEWRQNCPAQHRPFVTRVAQVFGIRL